MTQAEVRQSIVYTVAKEPKKKDFNFDRTPQLFGQLFAHICNNSIYRLVIRTILKDILNVFQ